MHPIDVNQSHQILGVKKGSTIKEIKQAYRSLSLQYHPDKNNEYKDGQKFKEISFVHHPLLKDSFGKKLSKSEGALSLKTLRKEKSEPGFIYRGVARSLDLPVDEIEDLKSLQKIFASIPLEKLNHRKLKDLTVF